MPAKVIDKKDMASLVESIIADWEVVGPVAKNGKFVFDRIDDFSKFHGHCSSVQFSLLDDRLEAHNPQTLL